MFILKFFLILSMTKSFALTNSIPADDAKFDSVVMISSEAPDSKGDTTPGYCNATLLNSHVMITAAHCALLAQISNDTKMTIRIGSYIFKTNTDGSKKRIGYKTNKTIIQDVHIELTNTLLAAINKHGEKVQIAPQDEVALLWWNNETPETENLPYPELLSQTEFQNILHNINLAPLSIVTINPFTEMQTSNTRKMANLFNVKWNLKR